MCKETQASKMALDDCKLSDMECTAMSVVGHILINHQKHKDAIVIYEALCMIDESNTHALKALAYLYVETKKFKMALDIVDRLRKVLELDGSTVAVINLLECRAFHGLNLTSKAVQSMRDYRYEVSQL
jgi:hypothetical protein